MPFTEDLAHSPTTLTPKQFWDSIDSAWTIVDGPDSTRLRDLNMTVSMARGDPKPRYKAACLTVDLLDTFLDALESGLRTYTAEQLLKWDETFFDYMEELDELQLRLHLNADSPQRKLLARAFVVLAGRRFYFNFRRDAWGGSAGYTFPKRMPYVARKVYEERFGWWDEAK